MPDYEFLNNIEPDAKKRDALLTKLFSTIGCENKSAYVNYRIHNTPFINMGNVNMSVVENLQKANEYHVSQ